MHKVLRFIFSELCTLPKFRPLESRAAGAKRKGEGLCLPSVNASPYGLTSCLFLDLGTADIGRAQVVKPALSRHVQRIEVNGIGVVIGECYKQSIHFLIPILSFVFLAKVLFLLSFGFGLASV